MIRMRNRPGAWAVRATGHRAPRRRRYACAPAIAQHRTGVDDRTAAVLSPSIGRACIQSAYGAGVRPGIGARAAVELAAASVGGRPARGPFERARGSLALCLRDTPPQQLVANFSRVRQALLRGWALHRRAKAAPACRCFAESARGYRARSTPAVVRAFALTEWRREASRGAGRREKRHGGALVPGPKSHRPPPLFGPNLAGCSN